LLAPFRVDDQQCSRPLDVALNAPTNTSINGQEQLIDEDAEKSGLKVANNK